LILDAGFLILAAAGACAIGSRDEETHSGLPKANKKKTSELKDAKQLGILFSSLFMSD